MAITQILQHRDGRPRLLPLGASFADWAGVSPDRGGLGLGSGWVSLALAVLIVASVVYLSYTQVARPAGDGRRLIPDAT